MAVSQRPEQAQLTFVVSHQQPCLCLQLALSFSTEQNVLKPFSVFTVINVFTMCFVPFIKRRNVYTEPQMTETLQWASRPEIKAFANTKAVEIQ